MKILSFLFLFLFMSNFGQAQICIPLPPMNGIPTPSVAPVGWTVWMPSPDIVDGDGPWPGGGGYVTSDVNGFSLAGGEMVMMLADGGFGVTEGLETTLLGLTPGLVYSVSLEWQQATLSNDFLVYAEGRLAITIDGAETIFTSGGGLDDEWQVATIIFIAGAATASFQCRAIETAVPTLGNRYTIVVDDYPCYAPLDINVTPAEVCEGDCVDLIANATGGAGEITYEWSPDILDVDATVTVCPDETTVYEVIGTDEDGVSDTTTVTVTVNPLPEVIAIASDTVICVGEVIILTGEGADTYEWDLGVVDGEIFIPDGLGTITYTVVGTDGSGCEGTATIDIIVVPLPIVTASASPMEICLGESIVFTGAGADLYLWDGGIFDGVAFAPDEIGDITYSVTGTDAETGCENTASVTVTVHEIPIVGATASATEICLGESIMLNGTGAESYTWTGDIIDGVSFTPDVIGTMTYTVIGVSEFGCEANESITIIVHEIPVVGATASMIEICLGESTMLNGTGGESYTWTGGVVDGITFTPDALGTTTYTVTGVNAFGCEATASIIITVIDCGPVVAGFEMPNSICLNECFMLNDTSLGVVAEWAWDFGGAIDPSTSTLQNPTICLNTAGTFTITLTVMSSVGAVSSTTQSLIVNPNPILNASLDTIIDLGGEAELISSTTSDGVFTWTPDVDIECTDCPITSASPSQNQAYIITLIDNSGCKSIDSVMVLVNYLLGVGVPTAFSPNGDGNNDVLFVKGQGLESIHFVIYNRYGEQIFVTTDQSIGWDGSFLNRDQNPGVFTWVLHYTSSNDKKGKLKGNTTLIR